jgi:hypothetical protein
VVISNHDVKVTEPMHLLYVEPAERPAAEPVLDLLTMVMAAALAEAPPTGAQRGRHVCSCGARSDGYEYLLATGDLTNSLAVHYLAFHRGELNNEVVAECLTVAHRCRDRHGVRECQPTPMQLQAPDDEPLLMAIGRYHAAARVRRQAAREDNGG